MRRRRRSPALDTNTHYGTCTYAYTHNSLLLVRQICQHGQPQSKQPRANSGSNGSNGSGSKRGGSPPRWPHAVKCILPIPDPQPAVVCVRCLFLRQHQSCHVHPRPSISSPISISGAHVTPAPGALSWTRGDQRTAQHSMAQA